MWIWNMMGLSNTCICIHHSMISAPLIYNIVSLCSVLQLFIFYTCALGGKYQVWLLKRYKQIRKKHTWPEKQEIIIFFFVFFKSRTFQTELSSRVVDLLCRCIDCTSRLLTLSGVLTVGWEIEFTMLRRSQNLFQIDAKHDGTHSDFPMGNTF